MKKYGQLGEELLLPQARSRKHPQAGDVFKLKLSIGKFLLGRVISTDAKISFQEESYLLMYLYSNLFSEIRLDQLDSFNFSEKSLIVPPFFSIRKFWTIGYASTIANRGIVDQEIYPVHYFFDVLTKGYCDEKGNEVEAPERNSKVPVGVCGLGNLATLDLDIRKVLKLEIPEWGRNYFAS